MELMNERLKHQMFNFLTHKSNSHFVGKRSIKSTKMPKTIESKRKSYEIYEAKYECL